MSYNIIRYVNNLVPRRFIFLLFVRFRLADIQIVSANNGLLKFVEFHLAFNSQQENIYRHYFSPKGSHVLKVVTKYLIVLRFILESHVKMNVADSFLLLCVWLYRHVAYVWDQFDSALNDESSPNLMSELVKHFLFCNLWNIALLNFVDCIRVR